MEKGSLFEKNILSLSQKNPELCALLTAAETDLKRNSIRRYRFAASRSGKPAPAALDPAGNAHPLHSMIDPVKEAKRLIDTVENAGLLILLGLGGGYYAEAALERDDTCMALVIEYDISGLAELLCQQDYTTIFGDPRFRLLAGITGDELEAEILNLYQPVLYGGIRVIPLRSRTSLDAEAFTRAGNAIEAAIEKVSSDFSVQAHFGTRWFSNIVRNIRKAGEIREAITPIRRAAVTAAGPSLSPQLEGLKEKRKDLFLIAADTSLPCLLHAGIIPDAVISIDCQHISYYHFMDGLPEGIPLFLDLASPPLLTSLSPNTRFFSGGHPLTRYISRLYRTMPELDTSGGNVTYAAVSLAEEMGALEIELYGADFSYPAGITYARGTYIYPFFEKRQNRFSSMEAQASAFLFRTPLEKKTRPSCTESGYPIDSWYYETKTLRFYRENLEEKSGAMEAFLIPIEGMGAPIYTRQGESRRRSIKTFSLGKALMSAEEFLHQYRNGIASLPEPGKNPADYLSSLQADAQGEAYAVFTTLLPAAAALKHRQNGLDFRGLLEAAKSYCLKQIDTVLAQSK